MKKSLVEIFGLFRDVFPVTLVENNATMLGFVDEVGKGFGTERRVATE